MTSNEIETENLNPDYKNNTPIKRIILIIIDDIRSDQFFSYYDNNQMPNIKKLGDNGLICRKCITTFPSITLPTQPNIMTGSYSGYYLISGSGIPNYHWFDRDVDPPKYRHYTGTSAIRMVEDIGPNVKTIFEQINDDFKKRSLPLPGTYSVFQICSRGVTKRFPIHVITGVLNYIYYQYILRKPHESHKAVTKKLIEVLRNPEKVIGKQLKKINKESIPKDKFKNIMAGFKVEPPIALTAYYPVTDLYMHEYGFDSKIYEDCVLQIDEEIGKLIQALKDLNMDQDTLIAITTDHGNYKAKKFKDLTPWIEEHGLVPYDNKGHGDFDLSFGSVGFFNFRGKSWKEHPTLEELKNFEPSKPGFNKKINLIDAMFEIEGVKYVYYRADGNTPEQGKIHVLMKDSMNKIHKASIEYKDDKTRYTFGDLDVFNYSNDLRAMKILDKKYHSIDEWLAHTYHLDFPMMPDQIVRYFKNPRSCDILVSTCGGVIYNYEHGRTANDHLYSHDIAKIGSMNVPLIMGVPTLHDEHRLFPKNELEYCKTTDIVPTLLEFLKIEPAKSVVGKSLLTYFKE
ncbi:MAG: alkaline phosphatase family protein [Promethearchaeota archaeon]